MQFKSSLGSVSSGRGDLLLSLNNPCVPPATSHPTTCHPGPHPRHVLTKCSLVVSEANVDALVFPELQRDVRRLRGVGQKGISGGWED